MNRTEAIARVIYELDPVLKSEAGEIIVVPWCEAHDVHKREYFATAKNIIAADNDYLGITGEQGEALREGRAWIVTGQFPHELRKLAGFVAREEGFPEEAAQKFAQALWAHLAKPEMLPVSAWSPIETAPDEEREILVRKKKEGFTWVWVDCSSRTAKEYIIENITEWAEIPK